MCTYVRRWVWDMHAVQNIFIKQLEHDRIRYIDFISQCMGGSKTDKENITG